MLPRKERPDLGQIPRAAEQASWFVMVVQASDHAKARALEEEHLQLALAMSASEALSAPPPEPSGGAHAGVPAGVLKDRSSPQVMTYCLTLECIEPQH